MVTKRIIDNAFIFLKPSLEEVYRAIQDPQIATIPRYDFICLSPYERYRQQSNSSVNIQLGQDYVVQLVDHCGVVLATVTDRVFIEEFQDSTTGLTNIYFEMINLPAQPGKVVHLKFTAPILSAKTAFYSNPFVIEHRPKDTTLLDYWSNDVFDGVDYPTTGALLRIRVLGHFTQPKPQEQVQVYSQTSARGSVNTQIESIGTELQPWAFTCEYITNHGLKAFQSFRRTPIKYINGIRCTSMTTSYEPVLGASNFYRAEWSAFMDETEEYTDTPQIYTPFALVSLQPTGVRTLAGVGSTLTGIFTSDITLGTGTLTIYDDSDAVIATFTEADVVVAGAQFTINISGVFVANGNYYYNFTLGLFEDMFGDSVELTDESQELAINDGDWDGSDFDNADWFTN